MNIGTYAISARRTQNPELSKAEAALHALFGMASEVGEIHSIFQHHYQGEPVQVEQIEKELGDLMWFVIELCDMFGIDPSHMLKANVTKLKKRYPDGFTTKESINRHNTEE